MKKLFPYIILMGFSFIPAQAGELLTGEIIGTSLGYNYESKTEANDIQSNAFDGDFNTYFATVEPSYTWVGLDLGEPYVIDKVGWSPRNYGTGLQRVQLGVFQGANSPDFLDAIPFYIIPDVGNANVMTYSEVNCSRGFRYVRYVSPGESYCDIAELEFYGVPGEGDDSNLFQFTNLPTVVINTVDSQEPYDKEHDITANIIIIDSNSIDTDKPGTIRERGNASREFPKKPWRIKFDKKQNILDAPSTAKKWTLINNYGDKTLMRNIVAFEIARRFDMEYVPWCRPVDVVLNGEYKGCYQLCDQVEVNPGRLEITEMGENDISGDALTGGYFFEVDAYAYQEPIESWFYTKRGMPVTIKSPDDGGVTVQYDYIKSYFNQLESILFSPDFCEPGSDYREILDIDSFIRHMLVGELAGNTDTYWSTYMYKDRNDPIIYTGPVWDFDIAFDNDFRVYPVNSTSKSDYLFLHYMASAAEGMKDFARQVIKNDLRTKDDILAIWREAREYSNLNSLSLNKFIDNMAFEIQKSQKLNFTRWPILNTTVHMNPRVLGSFSQEVKALKDYMEERITVMDKIIGYDPELASIQNISTGPSLRIMVRGNIITLEDNSDFIVYSLDGRKVFEGKWRTQVLAPGIYIVKTLFDSKKIIL